MLRCTVVGCAFAVAVLVLAGAAFGLLNPHIKPESCESCHTKVPSPDDGARGDFFLVKESIDATCHTCHVDACCTVANLSAHIDHPTNVDTWDRTKFQRPRTVPLFNGFIPCATCHYHLVPEGESFTMVRLATRDGARIAWVNLCRDCHVNY